MKIKVECHNPKCKNKFEHEYQMDEASKVVKDSGIKHAYYAKCPKCDTMNTGSI